MLSRPIGLACRPSCDQLERLEQFVAGAEAAGQHGEGVGAVGHHGLALVHRLHHNQLGQAAVGQLLRLQEARDDADGRTAPDQHGVGDGAHQADVAAAVDQAESAARQGGAEPPCGVGVDGAAPATGTAEDANVLHEEFLNGATAPRRLLVLAAEFVL